MRLIPIESSSSGFNSAAEDPFFDAPLTDARIAVLEISVFFSILFVPVVFLVLQNPCKKFFLFDALCNGAVASHFPL